MQRVCLICTDSYDAYAIEKGLEIAWRQLELSDLFKSGERVLIKPNLLSAVDPDAAVTTHPSVFDALAGVLTNPVLNPPLQLFYGDSPAHDSPARAARICGLEQVAVRRGIPMADFENSVYREFSESRYIRRLPIARGVMEADALIGLSKFKTHALTGITGAVKNQYGVIPGLKKARYHGTYADLNAFARMLADLTKWLAPRLFVMDAVTVMEGNGPRNGKPRQAGFVLAGTDPVAIDAVMAAITGHDPMHMTIFKRWSEMELGVADPAQIEICLIRSDDCTPWQKLTDCLEDLAIVDFHKAAVESSLLTIANRLGGGLMRRFILNRPKINAGKCIRCGQCVMSCPASPKALRQTGRQVPCFNYERCIRCYCCQEICPAAAITVCKPWSAAR